MKVRIEANLLGHLKNALREELGRIDTENLYPKPWIEWNDRDTMSYNTASGKGKYDFDFSSRGKVVIAFEGYRNSLVDGTPFFRLDLPVEIPVKDWVGRLAGFITFVNVSDEGIKVRGSILEVESSKPDLPLNPNLEEPNKSDKRVKCRVYSLQSGFGGGLLFVPSHIPRLMKSPDEGDYYLGKIGWDSFEDWEEIGDFLFEQKFLDGLKKEIVPEGTIWTAYYSE